MDNCSMLPNDGPLRYDTDLDGYGNACDGDFDQSLVVNAVDFGSLFLPDFATGIDSGVGTDMDCSGVVNAVDFGTYFLPQFTGGFPGPSGLPCAGTVPCTP